MAIINKFKRNSNQVKPIEDPSYKKNENKQLFIFKDIKESVDYTDSENFYTKYLDDNELPITQLQKKAVQIDKIRIGYVPVYKQNLFTGILNEIIENLSNEVFSDLKIEDEAIEEEIDELQSNESNLNWLINQNKLKEIFETAYAYKKIGIKFNVKEGFLSIDVLKPYQYYYDGEKAVILSFDGSNVSQETRVENSEVALINGTFVEDMLFYELELDYRFYDKLETLLNYDEINSIVSKETKTNLSKMFIDKKLWRDNPYNSELIQLLDVPEGAIVGETKRDSYFDIKEGKNSLVDIIQVKREVEMNMVNSFGLSKKTMGIDSGGQDFASSLPYENDKTAKTVNAIREDLAEELQLLFFNVFKKEYTFNFGRYSLESEEAKIDQNQKAISSFQRSISTGVNILNPEWDEDRQIEETIKIKLENNKTLTLQEEIKAGELELLPPLVGDDELDGVDSNEED